MNKFNDKIKKCFFITQNVISKYEILYNIMVNYAFEDNCLYECYVGDVKNAVLKEYDIFQELTLEDISICLKFLENIDCDNSKINTRFKRKLEILKDIYNGNKITACELGLNFIDFDFNLFDTVVSLIDIKMMKKVNIKLNNLDVDNDNDLLFVKLLFQRFNYTLFEQVFDNNLTEILGLFYNMDINKIPDIKLENLINLINHKYKLNHDYQFRLVELIFLNLSKITVDRLSLNKFQNNPEIVFDNLIFTTRLEILITYMSMESLHKLLNYCLMCRDNNSDRIDNIIKLVRDKLK